ncbi:hypothetical protein H2201_006591 [Coniosporium apollinis]|uniref:ABC transporter domain-containing protein n=1 Tax=Coniosporium apollinis TaxID=61459 RepID=A0ABQ9NLD5_9PEZI|nr:hypothetical protein H2201_006591 [Coniosporium apollinis]
MGFMRQTWTLTRKTLLVFYVRHWFTTTVRAFIAPIIFMFFISYSKNFFVAPSDYGVGSATPVRDFASAFNAATPNRRTIPLVNNGYTGGEIGRLIDQIAEPMRAAGADVQILEDETELLTICRSSLRGVTNCYAGASFHSSPTEGPGGLWNYTIRADGALGERIFVNDEDNDGQIYTLPFQHLVDSTIASINGTTLPSEVNEYPFTTRTSEEREDNIRRLYMNSLINILALAYLIGIINVCYQLTGLMATERELGISQLIEAMTPNARGWYTQAARLISTHLAFDIVHFPGWVVMSLIVSRLTFPNSSVAILIGLHILAGLSLSSWSIFGAAFFRKAQLSGIAVVIGSIVLAIIAQIAVGRSGTGAVAVTGLLFPPMTYTYFIIYLARWERFDLAANLGEAAPENPWRLPGIALWIFFIVQIIVYPVLAALVERTLYGTGSKERKMVFNPADPSKAIKINALSKTFLPGWWQRTVYSRLGGKKAEPVRAVVDLTLTVLQGQIMVLLGANGAGKSTTMDAIAGLTTISSGSIEVDGTGGVGLCPQKNVMWAELTVFEHIELFNALKTTGRKDSKDQIRDLAEACDLGHKLHARSKTLSGGQKRKLQLAMTFTGGSRVCCVDEVSSGLDPLSRRKIWDILLAERGRRTLLLTTHFLDEADVLSDYIAIMSKGVLKAEGGAPQLKHQYGGGYRVHIYNTLNFNPPTEFASVPRQVLYDQTVYTLPDSAQAAKFVGRLEKEGIHNYQVNSPTIEDVFLKLAEEVKSDLPNSQGTALPVQSGSEPKLGDELLLSEAPSEVKSADAGPQLYTGKPTTMLRQTWILFRKRLTILGRNKLPYAAAALVPIIAAGLVTLFVRDFSPLACSPGASASSPRRRSFARDVRRPNIPIGPSSAVSVDGLASALGINPDSFQLVETLAEFNQYIVDNYPTVSPGGFFLGDTPVFAYIGELFTYWGVFTQNLLDNALAGTRIATGYQEFASPFAPSAGDSLQLILYFGLAMSAYPGFFALYPTMERLRGVRALHYSNGIRATPLWLAYVCFDFLIVLVISVVAIGIFVGASSAWYYPGYLFIVFFLYGLTSILLSYVVSLFATSQLAAFAFAAGGQACFFLTYFIAYMCIITYSPTTQIDRNVEIAHFTIALVTPSGNLLRALLLTLNQFSLICDNDEVASYGGDISVFGGPILYLIVQALLLFGFLVWWDSGYKPAFLIRDPYRATDEEESDSIDADVGAELTRVKSSEDGLRVLHLTKTFGANTAVQNVTFGVKRGEVFALLGPNGAGKSTTISLIRGDIRPNKGDVLVENTSIIRHRAAARQNLGVCPQFDAMDQMTVTQHLRFYARARGVEDVEHNVTQVMQAVGLTPFASRMAAKLSGGNKRKLSLGIALMGNPSVLLLDEPSSGMDAAAKRVMWATLNAVSAGRSLVITTHSMEEADALAHRAGILARKMLAMGSSEELRRKWGDKWFVHVVHRTAPRTSQAEMEALRDWVEANIPRAEVEDKMMHGQLRFSVPVAGYEKGTEGGVESIAQLFQLLERHKEELAIEYYSVSQTTLDQVFLAIVRKHNVEEENSHPVVKGKGGVLGKVKKVFGG